MPESHEVPGPMGAFRA